MSIADKLTYLNETKNQLREAINSFGGNLTENDTFRSYPGELLSLGPATLSSFIWDSVSDTYEGVSENSTTSVHLGMRRCLLLDDGTVNYYLDPDNSALKEDGTPAVLDGSDGMVMVEIPKFWVRVETLPGDRVKRSMSAVPRSGFVLHPEFAVGGTFGYDSNLGMWYYMNHTAERPYTYVSAYLASVYSESTSEYIDGLNLDNNTSRVNLSVDKLTSVSGKYPMVGLNLDEFRQLAQNRGPGWCQQTIWQLSALQWLFWSEYQDFKSQEVTGLEGNVNQSYLTSSSSQTDSPHSVAGKSDFIGNNTSGLNASGGNRDVAWMSYRGVEHLWGNCYIWCDGVYVTEHQYRVSEDNDESNFTSAQTINTVQIGSVAPTTNGYIRNIQHDTLLCIPSSSSGGNASTFFADYYYRGTATYGVFGGGPSNVGRHAGVAFLRAVNGVGGRSRLRSGRLGYRPPVA